MKAALAFVCLAFGLANGAIADSAGSIPARLGACEFQLKTKCNKICSDIVAQYSSALVGERKIVNRKPTWYCHRLDPSEGLQRTYADSDLKAEALKNAGYTCYKGLPSLKSYYSRCYTSCLRNLCKP